MKLSCRSWLCVGFSLLFGVAFGCGKSGDGATGGSGGNAGNGGNNGTAGDGSGGTPGTGGSTAGTSGNSGSNDAGADAPPAVQCTPAPKLKLTLVTKTLIPTAWQATGWKAAPMTITQAKGDSHIFVAQRGGHILLLKNNVLDP